MGSVNFNAVQTGPLIEVPMGTVFLLATGGYQNSGAYGGIEIYFPF